MPSVTLICGGSGATQLIRGLKNVPNVEMNIVLNGYDDGKSTGRVRAFVGEMLGPSDFRKTISSSLRYSGDPTKAKLGIFLEQRIQSKKEVEAISILSEGALTENINECAFKSVKFVTDCAQAFLRHEANQTLNFNYSDCAVGNLVFAGCFLSLAKRNFNECVKIYSEGVGCDTKILNATDGKNLYLNACTHNDTYILDEGELVENSKQEKIKDIFFSLEKISTSKQAKKWQIKNILPELNTELIEVFGKSDLIIYSPGTQFSSLIPTYKTKDFPVSLKLSRAQKYLIYNLEKDKDAAGYSEIELLNLILENISLNGSLEGLVDKVFVDPNVCCIRPNLFSGEKSQLIQIAKHSLDGNTHDRDLAVSSIMNLFYNNAGLSSLKPRFCSIIVPTLDEGSRLEEALFSLSNNIDLLTKRMRIEVLVVDGARDTETKDFVESMGSGFSYVEGRRRRGESFRIGIERANGDLVCFFPGDNEYQIRDLIEMIRYSEDGHYDAVLGHRSTNFAKLQKMNKSRGIISKFGGVFASFILYLFHGLNVTDLLTTMRVYKAAAIRDQKFTSTGVDFDVEILLNLFLNHKKICEIPVEYSPRGYNEGKKIKMADGLHMLKFIVKKAVFK